MSKERWVKYSIKFVSEGSIFFILKFKLSAYESLSSLWVNMEVQFFPYSC